MIRTNVVLYMPIKFIGQWQKCSTRGSTPVCIYSTLYINLPGVVNNITPFYTGQQGSHPR